MPRQNGFQFTLKNKVKGVFSLGEMEGSVWNQVMEKNEEMDWDQRYRLEDTPWDKGVAAPALEELIKAGCFPSQAEVLVPGCRLRARCRGF